MEITDIAMAQKNTMKKNFRGLTLIEVVVAMAIFSILMVSAAQVFTTGLLSFKQNVSVERDVESLGALMNQIAKELRTSTVGGSGTGALVSNPATIVYYDYSQGKCIRYSSSSGSLATAGTIRRQEHTPPDTSTPPDGIPDFTDIATDCSSGWSSAIDVTPADTKLNLRTNESIAGKVGGVQMTFTLNSSTKPVQIRTFVSGRDYKKSGL